MTCGGWERPTAAASATRCLAPPWLTASVLWLEAFESPLAVRVEGGAVPGRFCCRAEGLGALYSDVEGGAVAVESGLSTLVVEESVVGLEKKRNQAHAQITSRRQSGHDYLGVVIASDRAERDSLLFVCS